MSNNICGDRNTLETISFFFSLNAENRLVGTVTPSYLKNAIYNYKKYFSIQIDVMQCQLFRKKIASILAKIRYFSLEYFKRGAGKNTRQSMFHDFGLSASQNIAMMFSRICEHLEDCRYRLQLRRTNRTISYGHLRA